MLDQLINEFGLSVFTAGLTVGMTYMALRGKLDRLGDTIEHTREHLARVEKKIDDHIERHAA